MRGSNTLGFSIILLNETPIWILRKNIAIAQVDDIERISLFCLVNVVGQETILIEDIHSDKILQLFKVEVKNRHFKFLTIGKIFNNSFYHISVTISIEDESVPIIATYIVYL